MSPDEKTKALAVLKQVAQHKERELMALAVSAQRHSDTPLTPARQVQAKKIQEKLAHLTPVERKQALGILRRIAQKQAQTAANDYQ